MFLLFRFVLLAIILPCVLFVSCNKDDEESYDVFIDFQNVVFSEGFNYNNNSGSGKFTEGIVSFQNFQPEGYWYGFAYSQMHDVTTFDYATNEFSAYVPGDSPENKFMVGYISTWDAKSIEISFSTPVKDLSLNIANNTLAALAMKGEDPGQFARKFEEGDLFTLTITSTLSDGTETVKKINLGEGTKIISNWEKVQITGNGIVKLDFSLNSTDIGDWGINTPTYFCIDNIQARLVK